jgi:hypothetical protein
MSLIIQLIIRLLKGILKDFIFRIIVSAPFKLLKKILGTLFNSKYAHIWVIILIIFVGAKACM